MLNRRHLRLKILQSLYAYYQAETRDLQLGEKELLRNIDKMTEAYILSLKLLDDLIHYTNTFADERDGKMLATIKGEKANRKFSENVFAAYLNGCDEYVSFLKKYKIKGQTLDPEFLRKMFMQFAEHEKYQDYISNPERSEREDLDMMNVLFKQVVSKSEVVDGFFEEKSMYWESDKSLVAASVVKTIKEAFKNKGAFRLIELTRDWEGDWKFAQGIFRKVVLSNEKFDALIQEKTRGWDVDRIAMMDVLILKLALAEMMVETAIPVKVTMNEYLELSKTYSTPKSSNFINGILDSLSKELVEKGEIKKSGRGLIG
ncbi:MAG: transcription antitermination factor NusB [Bacteroidia bacterium]|jgi:transcription antitermination protein NusB